MSKMGRYVYQLQEAEEKEQHDQDRKGHSNPATHPLTRVTIFGDGDQRIIPRSVFHEESRLVQALRQRVVRFQRRHPPKKFSVVRDGDQMRVFRIQ